MPPTLAQPPEADAAPKVSAAPERAPAASLAGHDNAPAAPPLESASPPGVANGQDFADDKQPERLEQSVPPPAAAPETPAGASKAPNPPAAPATDHAVIIFTDAPAQSCGACETVKISVAPSGKVLIERSRWIDQHAKWQYKHLTVNAGAGRAAAFAASLSAYRPVGQRRLPDDAGCPAPVTASGELTIEWIEMGRDDLLGVTFGCGLPRNGALAEKLLHAPDLLGLAGLAIP